MQNKLLVISGPTATGKTKLALHLSKALNGEIISADSRQVYKYMDIGTGKERSSEIKIWGYDLVNPDQEFSVSDYIKFADKTIKDIYARGKLPILVGGTGLYIKAVVDGLDRAGIPRDRQLRRKLREKTAEELFKMVQERDLNEANRLNNSDKKNPRRLIRLIEVLYSNKVHEKSKRAKFDVLWLGLTINRENLNKRIDERVDARIKIGFKKEIEFLKRKGFWDGITSQTIGYKDWPDVEKWKIAEHQYAKRQMTWFNKEKRINWFNVEDPGWQKNVEKLVKKW